MLQTMASYRYILHYQVIEGQPNTIHTDWTMNQIKERCPFLKEGWYSHHLAAGLEADICAHCCVKRQSVLFQENHVDPLSVLTSYGPDAICSKCKMGLDGPFVTVVHYGYLDKRRDLNCIATYFSDLPIEDENGIHRQLRTRFQPHAYINRMHTIGSRDELICNECCRRRLGDKKYEIGHNITRGQLCCKCEEDYDKPKKELLP